jgi:2',3'-cyclic-nucleotide 2'-phosphodiesterase/3'-nucleotidase/5'-nucleotidase
MTHAAGSPVLVYSGENTFMKISYAARWMSVVLLASFILSSAAFAAKPSVELRVLSTYDHGGFAESAAEIVAHDPVTQRLFVVNAETSTIDILDIADPANPAANLPAIEVAPYGDQANSVDVCNGIVAAAVQADVKTDNGSIVFFDTSGNFLNHVEAGALPDMVTFTPNCQYVLSANEGEPNSYGQPDSVDPEGSITVVDLRNGVANAAAKHATFEDFVLEDLGASVRVYGPGATVAQDIEPEYITVDHNSKTAYVTLQENNAIAVLDIRTARVTAINGLGFKDYTDPNFKLDASDRDVPGSSNSGIYNVRNWPVYGMYSPDSIAAHKYKNETFLITANEGDARDWPGFAEEARAGSLTLDQPAFAAKGYTDVGTGANGLRNNDNLGRLNVTTTLGNTDGDAEYEELYTLGGRSFSIWTTDGEQVFDSGFAFEQITYAAAPLFFNASNEDNAFDSRSDNKGPEPEAITIGKAYGRTYAFIGLERTGGVMVYDITNPYDVNFVQYINNRDFSKPVDSGDAKDLGPEGIHFIAEDDSPTGVPTIAVANEVSGTTTLYELVQVR